MEFEKTKVWGFEHAFRGMRNPKNSWGKSDSEFEKFFNVGTKDIFKIVHPEAYIHHENKYGYFADIIGDDDMRLAQTLIKGGTEHAKYMRMICVSVDTNMPRYWWSEADTYHFGTKNSCSTMHKLLNNDNPITMNMFTTCEEDADWWENTVARLESIRKEYKEIQKTTKDSEAMNRLLVRAKRMLPEGFEQMRTWFTNYAEIRNMYFQRRHHRLKEEWVDTFCKWVESLPYAPELIMYEG